MVSRASGVMAAEVRDSMAWAWVRNEETGRAFYGWLTDWAWHLHGWDIDGLWGVESSTSHEWMSLDVQSFQALAICVITEVALEVTFCYNNLRTVCISMKALK